MNEEITVRVVDSNGCEKWMCIGAEPDVHYYSRVTDKPDIREM